nr:dihydrofolate reductase [uncultured bacterium]
MKVFIIAAMTADGHIGQAKDHLATTWTNPEDKYLFKHFVKEANNMVMGLKTFLTTAKVTPTVFNKSMPGRRLFVYTHHPEAIAAYENIEVVTESPQELVARLEREGLDSVVICGGSQIYTMFMQSGVVTDLYIDMQATLFGEGVPLFNAPIDAVISLKEIKRLGDNNVLLHYQVAK